MAVVQISKIQIRRGKKNSDSGVPQLSSAELAWAVDTQELFIGNGSVAEGAPQVGNTKILTNNDNILELGELAEYLFRKIPDYSGNLNEGFLQNSEFIGSDLKRVLIDLR